jgi:very-short-patch-repair endonuclease
MVNITDFCRELRRQQTGAEKLLWEQLRNRKLEGRKFLRQHPLQVQSSFGKSFYYIPDFYCYESKLVIEADGPIHLVKKDYDKNRDFVLNALGLKILRFENEEISNDIVLVINKIKMNL